MLVGPCYPGSVVFNCEHLRKASWCVSGLQLTTEDPSSRKNQKYSSSLMTDRNGEGEDFWSLKN